MLCRQVIHYLARHLAKRQRRILRQFPLLDLFPDTLGDPFVLRRQRIQFGLVRFVLREARLVGEEVKRRQNQEPLIEQIIRRVVFHVHYVGLVVHGLSIGELNEDRFLVQGVLLAPEDDEHHPGEGYPKHVPLHRGSIQRGQETVLEEPDQDGPIRVGLALDDVGPPLAVPPDEEETVHDALLLLAARLVDEVFVRAELDALVPSVVLVECPVDQRDNEARVVVQEGLEDVVKRSIGRRVEDERCLRDLNCLCLLCGLFAFAFPVGHCSPSFGNP